MHITLCKHLLRVRRRATVAATMALAVAAACVMVGARAATGPVRAALVTQDATVLRASASDAAPQLTLLYRGEALEVRGERGEHLQVWDHQRERGGWVRRTQLMGLGGAGPEGGEADALAAVLGYVREQPGAETLGLALAAAAIQAAPAARLTGPLGAELLDAIGQQAERLAERASGPAPVRTADQAALAAHLDLAARQGVTYASLDQVGRTLLCYEGDAWRRLLAHPAASAEQRAHAALALTRPECQDPAATPRAREQADAQRAAWLDRVPQAPLAPHWRNRLLLRRAGVLASLAYAHARRGDTAAAAAQAGQALDALAGVTRGDFTDADTARYDEAALRVGAVRWAALPAGAAALPLGDLVLGVRLADDGQTCVNLTDRRAPAGAAPVQRCTWGLVWPASASANREGNAVALAVQPADGWRELWIFRKGPDGWSVQVLPPASFAPGLGYAEFAGWVPGGRQVLVAREAREAPAVEESAAGRPARALRRFELMPLDTLTPERTAFEPNVLGAFNRWQDPAWKRDSTALR